MIKNKKIWIDLDNTPHVPFFIPIINELKKKNCSVFLTTRDCFQVRGLADYNKLKHKIIGKHYGRNKLFKVIGTMWRCLQLAPTILKKRPDLSIGHGSRPLLMLSSIISIPTILLFDYEHAKMLPFIKPTLGICPEMISDCNIATNFKHGVRRYSGLKEDVYVSFFRPNASIMRQLEIREQDLVVTIRPPANEAHYHNPESEKLFLAVVDFIGKIPDARMVILPRNEKTQRDMIIRTWPKWCDERKIIIPDKVVNGLDLIWYSDFVISGGGTMNREAASLGVPVYSIFRGRIGAVDSYLARKGRLTLIETVEDIRSKVRPIRRIKEEHSNLGDRVTLKQIIAAIEEVMQMK